MYLSLWQCYENINTVYEGYCVQLLLITFSINKINSDQSESTIDSRSDGSHPNGAAVTADPCHLNDGGAVVHDSVDAAQLLKQLKTAAKDQSAAQCGIRAEGGENAKGEQ